MPIRKSISDPEQPADLAVEQKTQRVASTIQFPYTDMTDAVAVAEGMLKGGGFAMSRDQLAAAMGLSPNGGGFATKVATARMFGVIEPTSGRYELTKIGHEIVDPARSAEAKVQAFLNVDLYRRAYEEFRGRLLPPRPHGVEAAFVKVGVSPKTVRAARLAFEKSARMAGFFPSSAEDRLVMPFSMGASPDAVPVSEVFTDAMPANRAVAIIESRTSSALLHTTPANLHPSIVSWLEELPPPKSEWSKAEQIDWLQALAVMFRTIYKATDGGTISISLKPPSAVGSAE